METYQGANSGIGYALTKVIASAPDNFHVIMAGRSLDKVNSALSEIETAAGLAGKGKLSVVQLDVINEKSIEAAAAVVKQRFGHLDALINNAGVTSAVPDIRTRFQTCMETNVLGPTLVSEAFRPLLLQSKNPYSIYVSSSVGSLALAAGPQSLALRFPTGEMYRGSKAALNMVMLDEWFKFRDQGLKVFAIDPGFVVSNLRGTSEAARTAGGLAGDPDEPAKRVLEILNGVNDDETGKVLDKNGSVAW